jgi:pimeloyl-ACP methyl ester carboxylesterase
VENEQLWLPTRYGKTFAIASGPVKAPALLLFHGSGSNTLTWMGDVATWSQSYRVYAIDIIGEPGFSDPSRPDWHTSAYVEWMNDLLDALGLDAAALLGMSLGGWLVLSYSMAHPEKVSSLVLICPGGLSKERLSFMFKAVFFMMLGKWGHRQVMKLVGHRDSSGEGVSSTSDIPQEMLDFMSLVGRQFRHRRGSLPKASDSGLAQLRMPVKMFFGQEDALLNASSAVSRLRAKVPHAQIELLAGVGHVILGKADEILAFLNNCRPGKAV